MAHGFEIYNSAGELEFTSRRTYLGILDKAAMLLPPDTRRLGPFANYFLFPLNQIGPMYAPGGSTDRAWLTSGFYPLGTAQPVTQLQFPGFYDPVTSINGSATPPPNVIAESQDIYPGTIYPNLMYSYVHYRAFSSKFTLEFGGPAITTWSTGPGFLGTTSSIQAYFRFASYTRHLLFSSDAPNGRNINNAPYILKYANSDNTGFTTIQGDIFPPGFTGIGNVWGIETYDSLGNLNYSSRIKFLRRVPVSLPNGGNFSATPYDEGVLVTLPNTGTVKYLLLSHVPANYGIHVETNNSFRVSFVGRGAPYNTQSTNFVIYEES